MIDHVSIRTRDLARSRAFYEKALAPLGYKIVMEFEGAVGMGAAGFPDFWIGLDEPSARVHVAFKGSRKAIDAFHAAALAAGGADNGAPGLRPHYHENYYAAFITDPDGHNIEAVTHEKE